ncbi:hypothetical protein EDD21DRAFT_205597 [Dissophora ornata]|nr:hypothetical protein EDD21DRAFT_205597 [Dissophora ornata]
MGYPDDKKSSESYQGRYSDDSKGRSPRPSTSSSPAAGYNGGSPLASRASTSSTSAGAPALPSRQPSTIHRNGGSGSGSSSTHRISNGQGRGGVGASMSSGSSKNFAAIKDDYREVYRDLTQIYKRKIRPMETTYNFEGFHSGPLTDSDILAKPMVLLLGQYSTVSRARM